MSEAANAGAGGASGAPAADAASIGPLQSRLVLAVVLAIVLADVGIAALARCRPLIDLLFRRELADWRRENVIYADDRGFADSDDRLLLQEIPEADFSRGGVCFIGSSTTQHSIATWLLPPEEQALVRNLAIKSANMKEQFQLVRYLVERRGLLGADPAKMRIVVGLTHFDTRSKIRGTTDWNYVPALFERHGLYDYDAERGISEKPLAAPLRFLQRERMRACGFLEYLAKGGRLPGPPLDVSPFSPESDRAAVAFVDTIMGGADWKTNMEGQLAELAATFDYLHERGAPVSAVLLPLASWNRVLPQVEPFRALVTSLCAARRIPLEDESAALPDADFADHAHLNCRGQEALTPKLAALARAHLVAAGLIAPR
jgi:hypothetical protein